MTKLQTLLQQTIKELNTAQREKAELKRQYGKVNARSLRLHGQVELLHDLIDAEAIEENKSKEKKQKKSKK